MKFLLATLGSSGDLHPFLAVAKALRARGDEVELMSNAPYQAAVEREGVAFTPLCSARDHERTANHPDLWHPVRGFGVLWRHLAVPAIDPVLERVLSLAAGPHGGGGLVVLASPLAVGARLAQGLASFRLASVYTAPANLRPLTDPMFVGPLHVPAWTPLPARRAVWWALDRWKLQPLARGLLTERCRARGLPRPTGSLFGEWIHSPEGGVALYPASFGPAPAAVPGTRIEQADFPRFRADGDDGLPPALANFLDEGPEPVVVFAGSTPGSQGRTLLHMATQACRALGTRCVVLADPAVVDLSRDLGSVGMQMPHAPLASLLPRAAGFVHHGGIGSCAEGLAAGVPQVITPFAYDQFDNAARLRARHAALTVPAGTSSRGALLQAIQDVQQMPKSSPVVLAPGHAPTDAALAAIDRWLSKRRAA
jgi:rhamnosyltransferase subunit B